MKNLPLALILIFITSCTAYQKEKTDTVFYFIRHAEEMQNENNPHLSKDGVIRSEKYANFFANKKIDTVFTTNLNRTVETAKIIAKSKHVEVVYYNPFDIDFNVFLNNHKTNGLVIVGHTNTIPNFVNKLIKQEKYSQIVENNYSDIYKIVLSEGVIISDEVFSLDKHK